MFVEDLKNDFYNKLLGHRVLLLVHADVDGACACRVLQALFRCDDIPHTLAAVRGAADLQRAYKDNCEEIKAAVLVNCGGTIDLVELLQPAEDVLFFVLDSHKPSDVCNVYSDGQVRLVYRDNEEQVPNFEDIFRDEEDESEGEGESEETAGGAGEGRAAAVLRRRERRVWEQRRHTLMFNYTQFSYTGKASACVALELAWRLGRADVAALWAGCVAAEAQAAAAERPAAASLLDTTPELHQHATRLQRARAPAADDAAAPHAATVNVEKDVWLPLYRSWSVEAAVRHAPALAPHLRLHTLRGESRVRQLLADMGFPLQQARQAYRSMDVELRRQLAAALETAAARHALPPPTRSTFLLRRVYAAPLGALDLVYIVMALLEEEGGSCEENLQRALAALGVEAEGAAGAAVARGTAAARRRLECVARAVNAALAHRRLHAAGQFNYFLVPEGSPEAAALGRPLWLGVAARWAAACGGARGSPRPLLASATCADAPERCLVVGVPPRHLDEPRNLLGAAFQQAGEECGCAVSLDSFHAATVTIPLERRTHFFDALTKLLA